jgi:hypothetical protein
MSVKVDTDAVVKGFQASLIESPNSGTVLLEDYVVEAVTKCSNCGRDFDSPIFMLREKDTPIATFLVDGDCVADLD